MVQDIYIQSRETYIFSEISLYEFALSGVYIVWRLCSVLNLDQISVIVTEIDAHYASEFH